MPAFMRVHLAYECLASVDSVDNAADMEVRLTMIKQSCRVIGYLGKASESGSETESTPISQIM